MAFGIYAITFPDNQIYIGSTIQSFAKRKRAHFLHLFGRKDHNNYKMLELTEKYPQEKIQFIIVEQIRQKDLKFVIQREKYWIEHYGKTHRILNVAEPGGLGGQEVIDRMKQTVRSKEVRQKMSKIAKERIKKEKQTPVKSRVAKPSKHNVKTNPKKGIKENGSDN